jgi:AcrR family transcriptional regulator
MSQIAERTGIGRATLYKYFPDVEAILLAWHERQIAGHLAHLGELADRLDDPGERLEAVLEAYALMHHELAGDHRPGRHLNHGTEAAALLHRGDHVARAEQQLYDFVRELLTECAKAGAIRDDVPPDELALYCLQTLPAAGSLPSKAAVRRLVSVTLGGLRPSS